MQEKILGNLQVSLKLKEEFFKREIDRIISQGNDLAERLSGGAKVLICGNGGSAADAQHFAAELVGRFVTERRALPGIALSTDTSAMTAIGNDYGFNRVFARQVEALGRQGDLLVGISTSGNSENIIQAVKTAQLLGVKSLCLLGKEGGQLKTLADESLVVPCDITARVQEIHIMVIHFWCEIVDEHFKC